VFDGTHTGSLVLPDGTEVPSTGKRVEMPGMEFVKIRDGKIVVDNLYYDNLAVAAQLGLLPQDVPTTV
jgi:predicted ester cyclase